MGNALLNCTPANMKKFWRDFRVYLPHLYEVVNLCYPESVTQYLVFNIYLWSSKLIMTCSILGLKSRRSIMLVSSSCRIIRPPRRFVVIVCMFSVLLISTLFCLRGQSGISRLSWSLESGAWIGSFLRNIVWHNGVVANTSYLSEYLTATGYVRGQEFRSLYSLLSYLHHLTDRNGLLGL